VPFFKCAAQDPCDVFFEASDGTIDSLVSFRDENHQQRAQITLRMRQALRLESVSLWFQKGVGEPPEIVDLYDWSMAPGQRPPEVEVRRVSDCTTAWRYARSREVREGDRVRIGIEFKTHGEYYGQIWCVVGYDKGRRRRLPQHCLGFWVSPSGQGQPLKEEEPAAASSLA
jgi:hypothetical protein